MKKIYFKSIVIAALLSLGVNYSANAQALFKDMEAGNGVSSNPQQFTNLNGTVYFLTDPSLTRRHALWKTDGTVANTVMVKDSVISTNVSDRFMIRGCTSNKLFYTVNQNVQIDTTTELWVVENGSAPVLGATIVSKNVNQYSNGEPRFYTIVGDKLFFQMYTDHGYELWVSDGTTAGTKEVIDLFPGSTSGINNGGTNPVAMIGFNGKVYFQGITSYSGTVGLYSSDGTAAGTTLLKEGNKFDPQSFKIYNNELFFQAGSGPAGLWKTDGTIAGTAHVSPIGFNSDVQIFKNEMYFNVGSTMYKSNGTTSGTAAFKDSVGQILGMNNDYFLTRYMRTFSTPPYYEYYFWRSNGTAVGTERVADSLANAASFVVLNNKMYSCTMGNSLWESDGTTAGTKKLLIGIVSYPFILNNTVFFSNWGDGTNTGYELWSYTPGGGNGIFESSIQSSPLNIHPNPSIGHFQFTLDNIQARTEIVVYNSIGEVVYSASQLSHQNEIDISALPVGVYFVKVYNGAEILSQKIIKQ